ncbi:DUF1048 domain-containing protein [Streptomyces sp. NPDC058291]|uniref:DUF1048 domain-containing protein n=1 Tax=Streptomyces sp. NPDC058291 TaxID=3346427 RepID=UPI0036E43DF1
MTLTPCQALNSETSCWAEALPDDYRAAWEPIKGRLDFFEGGVAAGKGILEMVGDGVAAFRDDLVKDSRTYADVYQESISGEPGTTGK